MEVINEEMKALCEEEKLQDAQDQLGFQFMRGLALRYLGILHTRLMNYEEAKLPFDEALEIFRRLERRGITANQKTEMGELAFREKDYSLARCHYQDALAYYSEHKHKKMWVYGWIAKAYNGLGDIAYQQDAFDEAEQFYLRGLDSSTEMSNKSEAAYSNYRLASMEEQKGRYAKALQLAMESLEDFRQVGKESYVIYLERMIERLRSLTNPA